MFEKNAKSWRGMIYLFDFGEDGTICWGRRPFSKTWSWRKLGRFASRELILSHFSEQSRCYLYAPELAEDSQEESLSLKDALARAFEAVKDEPRWLLDEGKRWVIELTPRGSLTLERLNKLVP